MDEVADGSGKRSRKMSRAEFLDANPMAYIRDRACWKGSGYSANERLVLLILADEMKRDREGNYVCFPAQQTIADRCGVGLTTVKKVLRAIREAPKPLIAVLQPARFQTLVTHGIHHRSARFTLVRQSAMSGAVGETGLAGVEGHENPVMLTAGRSPGQQDGKATVGTADAPRSAANIQQPGRSGMKDGLAALEPASEPLETTTGLGEIFDKIVSIMVEDGSRQPGRTRRQVEQQASTFVAEVRQSGSGGDVVVQAFRALRDATGWLASPELWTLTELYRRARQDGESPRGY